jgi:hypothetical protein
MVIAYAVRAIADVFFRARSCSWFLSRHEAGRRIGAAPAAEAYGEEVADDYAVQARVPNALLQVSAV